MSYPNPLHEKFEPFTYKSLTDLRNKIKELELDIPVNPEVEILQQRVKLGNIFIPNRLAIQPMEGFDASSDGSPSDLTFRRYDRYANSGVGLIWFEATSIFDNCRTNPHQLVLAENTLNKFKELVSTTREKCNKTLKELGYKNECILILQLNHSGRYSRRDGKRFPLRAFQNAEFDSAIGVLDKDGNIISDEEMEEIEEIWINRVVLAKEIGFDGVDIKACHGYLINELLSSRTREDSDYGGKSLKKRAKLLLNIVKESRKKLRNIQDFIITSRMSVYNGIPYPYGFGIKETNEENFPATIDLSEPLEVIEKLYDSGVRLINITAGNPYHESQITRPFDTPIKGAKMPSEHPLFGVNRLINLASMIKQKVPDDMVVLGSGYSYLRQFAGHICAALIHQKRVDICGFGRMSFANPEFPKQILGEEGMIDKKKTCITCSKCSGLMRQGKSTGCVIRDSQYKK
jgi:2,4-dienoyl-CoA reductase-like NADH-dependent reductase (Old Yellow Enzyme family)